MNAAGIQKDSVVLDIGCGAGQVTCDVARIAQRGSVIGVVSSSLLEFARRRAAMDELSNVSFVHADAQIYDFGTMRCDIAVSRHGTMFFENPHAAFTNIAQALRPGGRLVQLVWQPLEHSCGSGVLGEDLAVGVGDGDRIAGGDHEDLLECEPPGPGLGSARPAWTGWIGAAAFWVH